MTPSDWLLQTISQLHLHH